MATGAASANCPRRSENPPAARFFTHLTERLHAVAVFARTAETFFGRFTRGFQPAEGAGTAGTFARTSLTSGVDFRCRLQVRG